jgi:hypothetical protein
MIRLLTGHVQGLLVEEKVGWPQAGPVVAPVGARGDDPRPSRRCSELWKESGVEALREQGGGSRLRLAFACGLIRTGDAVPESGGTIYASPELGGTPPR